MIIPFYKGTNEYIVPVTVEINRITFFTGYTVTNDTFKPSECGTVMINVALLDSSVYIISSIFVLLFISLIFAGVLIRMFSKIERCLPPKSINPQNYEAHFSRNQTDISWNQN